MFRRLVKSPHPSLRSACSRVQLRLGSGRHKVVRSADAVLLIPNECTVTVGGFVTQGPPEQILLALGKRFEESKEPNNLTLVFGGGPADFADKGINHFGKPGMLRRAIGSHYGQCPQLAALAIENKIEAYNLPLGSISRMIRASASGQPGYITSVGFGTLADPKHGGGKINAITKEDLVVEVELLGKKYLMYKALPIDVAIIRGTTADADGNITMERESLYFDCMIQAMAARSHRGLVLAQVERIAARGSLHPRSVKIPGSMVDCVIVSEPENHQMSFFTKNDPAATSEIRAPAKLERMPLDERKVIARRAALQLSSSHVVNLGIGMPEGVAQVAQEEGILSVFELTTEPGVHGGVGLTGVEFGPAHNYDALLEMNQQFDFYNGGGLDSCFLGMAEVNPLGDVNVTRVGNKLTGPGGFIDISQCTKRVNLLGTFTAGGLKVACENGKLVIQNEGKVKKFVKALKETTFSGSEAIRHDQVVHYITERCVFALMKGMPGYLELVEIAPGIDLQTQILDQMEFEPSIRSPLRMMRKEIFLPELMQLRKFGFGIERAHRFHYNKDSNVMFINMQDVHILSRDDIEDVDRTVRMKFKKYVPRGRAHVIVTYDGFDCREELTGPYSEMVQRLQADLYLSVKRYSSRAFARHKLAGTISIEEGEYFSAERMVQICRQLGLDTSEEDCHNLFTHVDKDRDGKLSGKELTHIIRTLKKQIRRY